MKIITKALKLAKNKLEEKKFQDVEELCEQIIRISPNNIIALELLGISKKCLKNPKESLKYFKKVHKIKPTYQSINNLGIAFLDNGQNEQAIKCFTKASKINNKKNIHLRNLAAVFKNKNEFEKAIDFYNLSLNIETNEQDLVSLAETYAEILDFKNTKKYLKKVLNINPKNTAAQIDLAYLYFLQGDYEKGYKKYQIRFGHYSHLEQYKKFKKWKGQNGKILLFCEQGVGDILNFIRFIKYLKQKTTLLVPPDIFELLKNQNLNCELTTKIEEDFDYQLSIIDLPYFLNLNKEQIQNEYEPYIHSNTTCDFSSYKNFYKIGICWAGNPLHPRDRQRSCNLNLFKQLNSKPNIKLFSLQKDIRPRFINGKIIDFCEKADDMRIVNMAPYMETWDHTASIINQLDEVISIDSSVLHLAAAMGKKTKALLSYLPDWRWGLHDTKSIWYPNIELFRQEKPNDWNSAFIKLNSCF
jgi:tetratricopeptide (TPR) repeat protein